MKDQYDIENHNINIICKENDNGLNRDNVEEQNPEDGVTNYEMNILLVVTTQDILGFQKVPKEQINTSLSDKELSTLLVVSITYKKTISKHVEI